MNKVACYLIYSYILTDGTLAFRLRNNITKESLGNYKTVGEAEQALKHYLSPDRKYDMEGNRIE